MYHKVMMQNTSSKNTCHNTTCCNMRIRIKQSKGGIESFPTETIRLHNHSILIFIIPSEVSVIPCNPTLFGPGPELTLPCLSSDPMPALEVSRVNFDLSHQPPALGTGDWVATGLLCMLSPGETARLLIEWGSKSSSLRRLLTFRLTSVKDGNAWNWTQLSGAGMADAVCVVLATMQVDGGVDTRGESIPASLIPDELLARLPNGGGVCILLIMLDHNSFCTEPLLCSEPVLEPYSRPKPSISDIVELSRFIVGTAGVISGDGGAVVAIPQSCP